MQAYRLLLTALYQYLLRVGDGFKVDSNGRRSCRTPKGLLKWRRCI